MRRYTVITTEAAITLSYLQLRTLQFIGGPPADHTITADHIDWEA